VKALETEKQRGSGDIFRCLFAFGAEVAAGLLADDEDLE
jgi:hypothetical protein